MESEEDNIEGIITRVLKYFTLFLISPQLPCILTLGPSPIIVQLYFQLLQSHYI